MTEHQDIQDPEDYTEEDYQAFERKLFSPFTQVSELEEVCMTLAHLPTKKAQDLLGQFKETQRASEVRWLDLAIEEGQFHYLSPENEQEERDYLALKVIQELEDELIELQGKYDELRLDLNKKEIEHEAIKELVKNGEVGSEEDTTLQLYKERLTTQMEELQKQISVKEKTNAQIAKTIKTEKYQNVDPMSMQSIEFC
jgi:hypothetical protein